MLRRAAARCTAEWRASSGPGRDVSSLAAQYAPDRSSFTLRRAVLFAFGAPLAALPLAALYDDGIARSLYFNAHALPALAHYRLVEWNCKDESEAEQQKKLLPLHERYAPVSLAVILRLKGFFIKLGQMGATPRALLRCARARH